MGIVIVTVVGCFVVVDGCCRLLVLLLQTVLFFFFGLLHDGLPVEPGGW